jgi:hypothetical protein
MNQAGWIFLPLKCHHPGGSGASEHSIWSERLSSTYTSSERSVAGIRPSGKSFSINRPGVQSPGASRAGIASSDPFVLYGAAPQVVASVMPNGFVAELKLGRRPVGSNERGRVDG